ncbi:hypothetical protein [Zhenhengia sp.]|uniref:hypothetical protein n=1 Tax=Zhenhengia sp. TaxID=2944208 RepID=UPI00399602DE
MEYRKMMLSFLKLLVEKRGIEVEPTGIIRVKGRELKIVELDIKVNELFDKEYFLNHMMENGIGFDVLDFYIEEAFEFMYIARTIFTVSAIKKLTLAIN